MSTLGGYHECFGGGGDIMGTFLGVQHIGVFNVNFKRLLSIKSSKAFQIPLRAIKHQLNCLLELTSGSFLTDKRDILVIPRNHQEMYLGQIMVFGTKKIKNENTEKLTRTIVSIS